MNDITIKSKYPLPLIASAFSPLYDGTIFTKMDLRNIYHLVRIREGDELKTLLLFSSSHSQSFKRYA